MKRPHLVKFGIKCGFFAMNMEIRSATEENIADIVTLMREFADYEKLSDYLEITETKLSTALFSEGAFVESLVALDAERLVAYALFYPSFASFRGEVGFYLEDIFVTADYRGKAVGEAMLKEIAKLAKSRGYQRIDFQVLDWNAPAISFYEKLGAVSNADESHFKFSGEAFDALAS